MIILRDLRVATRIFSLVGTKPGEREVNLEVGICYNRVEGTEHNVINNGDTAFSFVEVELK